MKLITILLSLLMLAATKECGEKKETETTDMSKQAAMSMDMNGTYDVTKVGENDFSDYEITMTLSMGEENRISGKSACNQYSGSFENPKDNEITVGMIAGTKMFCQDTADVEKEYLNTLRQAASVKTTKKGLHLLDKNGDVIIVAIKQEMK